MSLSLVEAVATNDFDAVKAAIDRGESLTNVVGSVYIKTAVGLRTLHNVSVLDIAAATGQVDIVALLLDHGCSLNGPHGYDLPATSLHWAAKFANMDTMALLIDRGADINAQNRVGATPLGYACASSRLEIIEYLLSRGADINSQSQRGHTVLHGACIMNNLDVVTLLLARGADMSIVTNESEGSKKAIDVCISDECRALFTAGSATKAACRRRV